MPNIPQYTSPSASEGLRPSDLASDAWQQAGRRIGTFYHQIGQDAETVFDTLQQHQNVEATAALTDKANQLDVQQQQTYDEQKNNPDFSLQKYHDELISTSEGLDPSSNDEGPLGNVFAPSDTVTAHARELQSAFVAKHMLTAMHDQSEMAGERAAAAYDDANNQTAKELQDHPEWYEIDKGQSDIKVQGMLGHLPPEVAAKDQAHRTELYAGAALDGYVGKIAQSNGDPAIVNKIKQAALDPSGALYKDATYEQVDRFNKMADDAGRAAQVQYKAANREDFDQKASGLIGNYIQPDGSLRVPPGAGVALRQLSQHPGATPGEIKSIGEMNASIIREQEKGTKVVSDPQTYQLFGDKMAQGNLSVQEISDARSHGLLSTADTSYFMRRAINPADPAKKDAEKQFNAWANSQKPAFTRASSFLGMPDPQGAAKFSQFYQDAHARFEQLYDSKGDWQGSLDAKKPNYLGSIAPQYMHSIKGASLNGTVVKGVDGTPYVFKGQTAADWKNPKMWQKQGGQ